MKKKTIKIGTNNLHLIKTDKFKTISIKIVIKEKLKKENITKMNLLSSILTYSTKKYPSKRLLQLKEESLFNTTILTERKRMGKYNSLNIEIITLGNKYADSSNIEEVLKLLSEILYNPNIENDSFNETSFNYNYEKEKNIIESLNEEFTNLSVIRLLENMTNQEYRYHNYGYIEDLEKITKENLINYYNDFINNKIDIFIIGDINEKDIEKYVKSYFKNNNLKSNQESLMIKHNKIRRIPKQIKETLPINQSKLSIGFKYKFKNDFEKHYVSVLYYLILGGGSEGKLFKIIREKYSFCYYIYITQNKLDNIFILKAGIDKTNYKKTIELTKKLFNDMKKGNFNESDIENAKKIYINSLKSIEDSSMDIIDVCLGIKYSGNDEVKDRIKIIPKVTKQDIIKFAKKVKMDTIFLLEGEKDEEDKQTGL